MAKSLFQECPVIEGKIGAHLHTPTSVQRSHREVLDAMSFNHSNLTSLHPSAARTLQELKNEKNQVKDSRKASEKFLDGLKDALKGVKDVCALSKCHSCTACTPTSPRCIHLDGSQIIEKFKAGTLLLEFRVVLNLGC